MNIRMKLRKITRPVAQDPKAAKRMGIPQSVGKDYVEADKGKKFAEMLKRVPKRG